MPIELIGVDQLEAIFNPLKKVLSRLGLGDVGWEMLVRVYDEQRYRFIKHHHISKPSDLTKVIAKLARTYPALTPEIRKVMETKEMAFDIARQVSRYSAEIFVKIAV